MFGQRIFDSCRKTFERDIRIELAMKTSTDVQKSKLEAYFLGFVEHLAGSFDGVLVVSAIGRAQSHLKATVENIAVTWWRHEMEAFSALLVLREGNPLVAGGFSSQRSVMGSLMFSSICTSTNCWANNRDGGDLRRHRAHYYVIVMKFTEIPYISDKWSCFSQTRFSCASLNIMLSFGEAQPMKYWILMLNWSSDLI